jgi:glycosyltransferase involved in cell wall biosynthesis
MPVYNALPFLDDSVGSILEQSFTDFELVILDDGSTDGSTASLRRWAALDARIRLLESPGRGGAVRSSNLVTSSSAAPLIARMDADDVAHPRRLERQVEVLKANPDAIMVGALGVTIDAAGRPVRPADYGRLVRRSAFAPFSHSSVMFRRQPFERLGGYRAAAEKWEDVDLFLRMAGEGRILVLAEPLIQHRQAGRSTRSADGEAQFQNAMALLYRCIREYERRGSYEDLLEEPAGPELPDPLVLLECGSGALWAGERAGMFRRAAKRAMLRPDSASLKVLAWAAWAELNPGTLRAALRWRIALSARRARKRLGAARVVEWRPWSRA